MLITSSATCKSTDPAGSSSKVPGKYHYMLGEPIYCFARQRLLIPHLRVFLCVVMPHAMTGHPSWRSDFSSACARRTSFSIRRKSRIIFAESAPVQWCTTMSDDAYCCESCHSIQHTRRLRILIGCRCTIVESNTRPSSRTGTVSRASSESGRLSSLFPTLASYQKPAIVGMICNPQLLT